MASMPRFENMWTPGNFLTMLTMAIGGLFMFVSMQNKVDQLFQIVTEMKQEDQRDKQLQNQNDRENEARLRALELGFGRVEERLVTIQSNQALVLQLIQEQNRKSEGEGQ